MTRPARLTATMFRLRMSERDSKRLAWLAKHYETTSSEVLRRLVMAEYTKLRPEKAPEDRKVEDDGSTKADRIPGT